jgi:hypothetical protein
MTYCLNVLACSLTPGGLNVMVVKRALKEIDTMNEFLISARPQNVGAQLIVLKESESGSECLQKDYKFSISPSCKMDITDFKSQTIDSSSCVLSK